MASAGRWRAAAVRIGWWAPAVAVGWLAGRGAGLAGIAVLAPAAVLAATRLGRPGAADVRGRREPAVAAWLRAADPDPAVPWCVALGEAAGAAPVLGAPAAVAVAAAGAALAWARPEADRPRRAAAWLAVTALVLTLAAHPAHPVVAAVAAGLVQAALGAVAGLASGRAGFPWVVALGCAAASVPPSYQGGDPLRAALLSAGALLLAADAGSGAAVLGSAGAVAGMAGGAPLPAALLGAAVGGAAGAGAAGRRSIWTRALWTAAAGIAAALLVPSAGWRSALAEAMGVLFGALAAAGSAALWLPGARAGTRQDGAAGAPDGAAAGWGIGGIRLAAGLRDAAAACLEIGRGLGQVRDLDAGAGPGRDLRIAEQVCPGCPALSACWERRYPRARKMVNQLWRAAERAPVTWQQVGGTDTIFCLRPREMADAANRQAALFRERQEMLGILAANRRSAVLPLVAVGRRLADLADVAAAAEVARVGADSSRGAPRAAADGAGGAPPAGAPAPEAAEDVWGAPPAGRRMGYACSAARLPRAGRPVSGDGVRCEMLGDERLVLALSDGMGSGGPAAAASGRALEHLLAALGAGLSPEDALRSTNADLASDRGAERFATVDLAVIHLRGGLMEWYKMGAPPGFVLAGAGVRALAGGGLPAGILEQPEIRSGRSRLRDGDLLVLCSDGIAQRPAGALSRPGGPAAPPAFGAGPGRGSALAEFTQWLRDAVEGAAAGGAPPAARLVRAAAERDRGSLQGHDDLTALVCGLAGPEPARREGGGGDPGVGLPSGPHPAGGV